MKFKKIKTICKAIIATMLVCLSIVATISCSTDDEEKSEAANDNSICGEWFNSNGKSIKVYDNGTYKCEGEYGLGKWTYIENIDFIFTDFYGDTTDVTIKKDDDDEYIKYNGKRYYKDAHPEPNEKEPELIELDAFKGISFSVSGISPYCKITVNNQNCDRDAQLYVEYTVDKQEYANGESATITAKLNNEGELKNCYTLKSTEYTYSVKNQPEYITSITNKEIAEIKKELTSFIEAEKGKVIATAGNTNYLFSMSSFDIEHNTMAVATFSACDSIVLKETHFSSLKLTKTNLFSLGKKPFNGVSFVYKINYSWISKYSDITGTGTAWFTINANNVVRYSDGSIKWGTSSIGDFEFTTQHSTKGLEECVMATITINAADYNISKKG